MELSHSGQKIDCAQNPIKGAILALNASSGCGSKSNAWSWAQSAVTSLAFLSESKANELQLIIDKSNSNYPNTGAGLKFVESLENYGF